MGFRTFEVLDTSPSCHPNYRAPDFCPGRSISCWTHQSYRSQLPYGGFSPVRLQGWLVRRDLPNTSISLSLLPAYTDVPVVCLRPSCITWPYRQPAQSRTCGLDNAPPWRVGCPPPQGPSLGFGL